jgi:hypothetical protein
MNGPVKKIFVGVNRTDARAWRENSLLRHEFRYPKECWTNCVRFRRDSAPGSCPSSPVRVPLAKELKNSPKGTSLLNARGLATILVNSINLDAS